MNSFFVWCLVIVLTIGIAGCGSAKVDKPKLDSVVIQEMSKEELDVIAEKAGQEASREAEKAAAAGAPWAIQAAAELAANERPRVVIETNKGTIIIEMYPGKAPKTVQNFVNLVKKGFYNGIKWHFIAPGNAVLGGDPLTKDKDPKNDGSGGPGYSITMELNDMQNDKGTVGMAPESASLSAGSQFYICLARQPQVDGKATVFGQVIQGMEVVEKLQVNDIMKKVYIDTSEE